MMCENLIKAFDANKKRLGKTLKAKKLLIECS